MRFYVYELRDETGRVFYVGKGSGRRMYQHKYQAKHGQATRRADYIRDLFTRGGEVVCLKVFETDDEVAAYAEEVRLIAFHGRANLTNDTDGGCGIRNLSQEARERLSASLRGKKASDLTRQRQREAKLGTHRSEETKAKISAYNTGRKAPWATLPRSEEYKRAMSVRLQGREHTEASIKKMSIAKMGHPVSQEARDKISRTKRQRNAEKRPQQELFPYDDSNVLPD